MACLIRFYRRFSPPRLPPKQPRNGPIEAGLCRKLGICLALRSRHARGFFGPCRLALLSSRLLGFPHACPPSLYFAPLRRLPMRSFFPREGGARILLDDDDEIRKLVRKRTNPFELH
jgi:hypothetical protein